MSKRLRADLALLFCSLVWGGTFIVVKDALADVSIFTYIAVRFALAALVMAILFWRSLRDSTGTRFGLASRSGCSCLAGTRFKRPD